MFLLREANYRLFCGTPKGRIVGMVSIIAVNSTKHIENRRPLWRGGALIVSYALERGESVLLPRN